MEAQSAAITGYVVPTYRASSEEVWYHFLHGNVPGHEIDFIYRPEVPQGPLTRQHFSHLSRLVKYIEPRVRSAYAFAIGNLSRDDTQYEPGRGGLALIFGLRIQGAKDHAGRQDPPFCHAVAAIDRHLDASSIYEAAVGFYHKLLPDEESQAEGSGWYHTYVQQAQNPDALLPLLKAYVADFADLPAPGPSALGFRWTAEGVDLPKRIVIVHAAAEPFTSIAACAARIAGVLAESDIRWTAISNGREADVPGGVSIRFVPEHEAGGEPSGSVILRLEEVPQEPGEIAAQLFGAQELRLSQMPDLRMGWRQLYEKQASDAAGSGGGESVPPLGGQSSSFHPPATEERPRPWAERDRGEEEIEVDLGEEGEGRKSAISRISASPKSSGDRNEGAVEESVFERSEPGVKKSRNQFGLLVGFGVMLALGGAIAAVAMGTSDPGKESVAPAGNSVPEVAASAEPAVSAMPEMMVSTVVPSAAPAEPAASVASAESAAKAVPTAAPSAGKPSGEKKTTSGQGTPSSKKGAGGKKSGGKTSVFVF